jgi:hypothetical protein
VFEGVAERTSRRGRRREAPSPFRATWFDDDDDDDDDDGEDDGGNDENDDAALFDSFAPVSPNARDGGVTTTAFRGVGASKADAEAYERSRVNKRVRDLARVMRDSLSRVGCASSEADLKSECVTLVDRLKRFVAEGASARGGVGR